MDLLVKRWIFLLPVGYFSMRKAIRRSGGRHEAAATIDAKKWPVAEKASPLGLARRVSGRGASGYLGFRGGPFVLGRPSAAPSGNCGVLQAGGEQLW